MPDAPRTTAQTAGFLKSAHAGPLSWRALCLSLQRQARGLPAVYPSALAAAEATPREHRVTRINDLRRGMVAYSDDPNDGNPYGHIYFIAGRDKAGRVLTWTNDALRSGGVDLVPLDFYQSSWGDRFQFGATWLNGYTFAEFDDVDKPAKPEPHRATLGDNYRHAIDDVRRAQRHHAKKGNTALADRLARDLARMERLYDRRKES